MFLGVVLIVAPTYPRSYQKQGATATAQNVSDDMVFPLDLICEGVEKPYQGPTWEGIKVGVSSLTDLKARLKAMSDNYTPTGNYEDPEDVKIYGLQFYLDNPNAGYSGQIPYGVRVCLSGDLVTVLDIGVSLDMDINISDFVDTYGTPDAVTWTNNSPTTRVAFWFKQGLAVEIATIMEEPTTFGKVGRVIYFPYGDTSGYESRWPYAKTRSPTYPNVFEGSFSDFEQRFGKQNPFDFNKMIATITAQLSHTPTSTFTPSPSQVN